MSKWEALGVTWREREREGERAREREQERGTEREKERDGAKLHDQVRCTPQSPTRTTFEPKGTGQPERTTRVKLNRVFCSC